MTNSFTSNMRFLSVSSCSSSCWSRLVGTREIDDWRSVEAPALDSSRFVLSSASTAAFASAYGDTGAIAQQMEQVVWCELFAAAVIRRSRLCEDEASSGEDEASSGEGEAGCDWLVTADSAFALDEVALTTHTWIFSLYAAIPRGITASHSSHGSAWPTAGAST